MSTTATPRSPLPYGYSLSEPATGGYLKGPEGRTPWICVRQGDAGFVIEDNSDARIPDSVRLIAFPTPEHAAAVGLAICREHDRALAKWAAPKPLLDGLDAAERAVDDLERKARDLAYQVASAKSAVNQLRKAAGLPENEWSKDDLLTELDTFTLGSPSKQKHGKHPFFTEAILYDLLGKQDARSVLALITQVKRRIDPVNGSGA